MEERITRLIAYSQAILQGKGSVSLYEVYKTDIESIKPADLFLIENEQLKMGKRPKELLKAVDKLINAFYKPLSAYQWLVQPEGFIYYLMQENRALEEKLDKIKDQLKSQEGSRDDYLTMFKELGIYNQHLVKLENILFPYLERLDERYDGLKIMWSLHDDLRKSYKWFLENIHSLDSKAFMEAVGGLFFYYKGLVKKQELILFPLASERFSDEDFEDMQAQTFEYEYAFIEKPHKSGSLKKVLSQVGQVNMATGQLSFEALEAMINTLPVDITLVDEKDEVAFFSRPKERIFPRSLAVIGRNVRNCHPPESVHMVEEIIESFRNGQKDQEDFWIQMRGQFILIQYFALRSDTGKYLGTLEVSQEISHIKALEGEKRLLTES